MTKTNVKTKPPTLSVEDAAKARDAATKRLDTLKGQLTAGTADVSADELADASTEVEHAQLQLQGAQARRQREQDAQLEIDVAKFTQSWPKRLAGRLAKIAPARSEATEGLAKLYQAVAGLEDTRATIRSEWTALRPDDIPPDADDQLPDHYAKANPSRDHRIARLDPTKAVLAAAVDVIEQQGPLHNHHHELVRIIQKYVAGQEQLYRNATNRTDLNTPKEQ